MTPAAPEFVAGRGLATSEDDLRHRWRRLLWALVYPAGGERIRPTLAGVLLFVLAMGVGLAAYNTASNILFITLSLLLACLILSGVMSWMNFRKVAWRLQAPGPWRVGHDHTIGLELRNDKRLLPTYGLFFLVKPTRQSAAVEVALRERLDARGGESRLELVAKPQARGLERVELVSVGSLFPFGFLNKSIGVKLWREVLVWPASVEYRRMASAVWSSPRPGVPTARVGQGGDLHSLRGYAAGDSHRLIHWKASARLGRMVVRQFAAESRERVSLWLDTADDVWVRPEQFELLVSFAATLAEDLFKAGRLAAVAVNAEAASPVRGGRDIEDFLDALALVETVPAVSVPNRGGRATRQALTFGPDGARGVIAYLDGKPAATT